MNNFYVYIWFNDDWGKVPIYVGKGRKNRFSSLQNRSLSFLAHVSRWNCHSEIVFDGLPETVAMRFEKALKDGFIRDGLPILDAEAAYRRKVSQSESIKLAKKRGVKFGRPSCRVNKDEFQSLIQKQKDGQVTVKECCEQLGISRSTWYDLHRKVG